MLRPEQQSQMVHAIDRIPRLFVMEELDMLGILTQEDINSIRDIEKDTICRLDALLIDNKQRPLDLDQDQGKEYITTYPPKNGQVIHQCGRGINAVADSIGVQLATIIGFATGKYQLPETCGVQTYSKAFGPEWGLARKQLVRFDQIWTLDRWLMSYTDSYCGGPDDHDDDGVFWW